MTSASEAVIFVAVIVMTARCGAAANSSSISAAIRGDRLTVTKYPENRFRIVEHPADQFVSAADQRQGQGQNHPITLNCKASSGPSSSEPQVTWYRGNGRRVVTSVDDPTSHRMQLPSGQLLFVRVNVGRRESSPSEDIGHEEGGRGGRGGEEESSEKVDEDDLGEYYCEVTERESGIRVRSRKAKIDLAVLGADFIEQPRDYESINGDRASFRCRAPDGRPEPRVRWIKDGRPLTPSVSPNGRLRVSTSVVDDDVGNEDHVSPEEEHLSPKLVVLTVDNVGDDDAGLYSCVASNVAGERVSQAARLIVGDKPRIITVNQEVTVLEGSNATLQCRAIGKPSPTVFWKKLDGQLPSGRSSVTEDGGLRISRVTSSDDGLYSCRAENSIGWHEKQFTLNVQSPPSFSSLPQDRIATVGRKVELKCQAVGNPMPAVFWTKETSQTPLFSLQDHGRASVSEDGTLVISSPLVDDSGVYVCNAVSSTGTAYAKINLLVTDDASDGAVPPVVVLGPYNQTVAANTDVVLTCLTAGEPSPNVRWSVNGRPINAQKGTRYSVADQGTLLIAAIQPSDSGPYTCRASNEAGVASWSAFVAVVNADAERPLTPTADPSRGPVSADRQPPRTGARVTSRPTVSNVTETSVTLTWLTTRGAAETRQVNDGFIVEYFTFDRPQGWMVASDMVFNESFTVRDLRPDTAYFFVVRPRTLQGPGFASPITSAVRTKGW